MTVIDIKQDENFCVEGNMTGEQIANTLDTILYSGVEALIYGTTFVDQHVMSITNWVCRNNRRRISSHKHKGRQYTCLTNFLHATSSKEKLRYFTALRPDRYVCFGLLHKFLVAVGDYQTWYDQEYRMKESNTIELQLGSTKDKLWSVIETVRDCLEQALNFRNYIVRKYIRLCKQEAAKLKRNSLIPISEKDLSQNLTQAVIISLDKYDWKKGALTTYIRPWLKYLSQSPEFGHEVGLAYDIPHNHKQNISSSGYNNIGLSAEVLAANSDLERSELEDSVLSSLTDYEDELLIRKLLQRADPQGLIRLVLGLTENINSGHKRQMRRQVRNEAKFVKKTVKVSG